MKQISIKKQLIIVLALETRGMSQPFETMWMKASDRLRGRKENTKCPLDYNQAIQLESTLQVEQRDWKDSTILLVTNSLAEPFGGGFN